MKTKLNLGFGGILHYNYGTSLLAKAIGRIVCTPSNDSFSFPIAVIKRVQAQLFSFLWRNRKDKIKRAVMYQPLTGGGINFVNFATMVKALHLAWISRLLSDSWKAIPKLLLLFRVRWFAFPSQMRI